MLRVVENFAATRSHSRSFEVTALRTCAHYSSIFYCVYLVPLRRYSTSNNGVPLKSGLWVVQGQLKMAVFIAYDCIFVFHFSCGHVLYLFRDKKRHIGWKSQFFSHPFLSSLEETAADILHCFITEPNLWHNSWFKSFLQKAICLSTASERHTNRRTDIQTEKRSQ